MTKRIGHLMNHYKFRERLLFKCVTLGSKLIVSDESYTTKTCPLCGYFNEWVKYEKRIKCRNCNNECDRDTIGAINILLKKK